jgi:dTDP-4-amino-4,6-dideoxygalactose transaminase
VSQSQGIVVPQTDPKANYLAHRAEIDAAIQRVLDSGWYILGHEVETFERQFAAYVGVHHAIGVGSGTDALELALRASGVGPGDLVFTVSHTAVATVAAIELTGATPVLVDIDPVTYTMDPNSLADVLNRSHQGHPKAVIPVHLYGQPADLPAIMELARRYGLRVVEDCAQSHGATLAGRMTGSWGDVAAFSFYPTKNLGALGDGGIVVTNDSSLADKVRLLRQYGWRERYVSDLPGLNSRLDELQAAILSVKLRYLDEENQRRRDLAKVYNKMLSGGSLVLPTSASGAKHVYHQYVMRTANRDGLKRFLTGRGVGTAIHYPVPVHRQPAYEGRLPCAGSMTNTEMLAGEVLSLPMYPQLTEAQVQAVCEAIVDFSQQ